MSTVTTNKALVLSGESKNAILTLDEQLVHCTGENAQIIHTGKNIKIYDNEGSEDDEENGTIKHGKNSLFITSGEESFVEASSQSVTFSSGQRATISHGYDSDENGTPLVKNTIAITTGDEAIIYGNAENSIGISTGDNTWVQDLTEGSIGIATGNNANVVSEGNFKAAAIFGDHSEISGMDASCSAFVGGQNCSVNIGENGLLLSEFPLNALTAGANSVIVVGWHDGERKRFSTYYQGTDFEGDVYWVTKDPETGKKTQHYRNNTYKTTELGELVLTGTQESEKDISWQKD